MRKKKLPYIAALLAFVAVFCALGTFAARGDFNAEARMAAQYNTKENIRIVQQKLKDLGYYKKSVDGIYGSGTRSAVKAFQKAKGLTADGIVGAKTVAALGVKLSSSGGSGGSSGGGQTQGDVYLLAKCIYAEARGEPYEGQVAVGAVVLNRVKSAKFPNTISGVIYQPLAFTAVADGQINLSPNQQAMNAAQDCLNGWDPTQGCLFYYNPATATSAWIWSLKVYKKIGRHNFCHA